MVGCWCGAKQPRLLGLPSTQPLMMRDHQRHKQRVGKEGKKQQSKGPFNSIFIEFEWNGRGCRGAAVEAQEGPMTCWSVCPLQRSLIRREDATAVVQRITSYPSAQVRMIRHLIDGTKSQECLYFRKSQLLKAPMHPMSQQAKLVEDLDLALEQVNLAVAMVKDLTLDPVVDLDDQVVTIMMMNMKIVMAQAHPDGIHRMSIKWEDIAQSCAIR